MNHGFIDLFIFKGAVTCCFDYLLNYLQLEEIANSIWLKKTYKEIMRMVEKQNSSFKAFHWKVIVVMRIWSTTTSKRCVMTYLCRITKRKLSRLHFRSLPWIPQRSITQSMVVTAFQMTRPKRKRESFPKENKCLKRSPKDTIRLEGTVLKDSVAELTSCF